MKGRCRSKSFTLHFGQAGEFMHNTTQGNGRRTCQVAAFISLGILESLFGLGSAFLDALF